MRDLEQERETTAERLGLINGEIVVTPAPSPGIEGAPNLVAEIVSPTTHVRDRVRNRNLYARCDIPEFWLVDPEAKRIDCDAVDGRYLREVIADRVAVSATIPGLSVGVAQLFAPIPGA